MVCIIFFNSMLDVIEIAIIMLYVANCDENFLPVNYPLNTFRKKNKPSDFILFFKTLLNVAARFSNRFRITPTTIPG